MLSRYNVLSPLSPIWSAPASSLESTMNRLFEDFETAFTRPAQSQASRQAGRPRVQLYDRGDGLALFADLPGARLEDIDLSIEGELVTLRATPRPRAVPEGFTPLRRERKPATLAWSFALPYPIDTAAASAVLDQGRLSVSLPKAPEAKPRTIPVTVKAG